MTTQSEALLENNLIKQLVDLGYELVKIHDGDVFISNLKTSLEAFNKTTFTTKEFDAILNHLAKGNEFVKAKTLRDRFQLSKENGESFYVRFFNNEDWSLNKYQVTNQVQQQGSFLNRYDVTILINGLPLVQIELKRTGIEIKEAFNQINRYQRHSFWSNHGLFQYVQMFIISNGINTKYLANNKLQSVKQTFYWADSTNKNVTGLTEFASAFLNTDHLGKMISHYVVMNETFKNMMVLRPYQYFATEAIIEQVKTSNDNGYIWHTTGSGKTLTSFKASQIVMDLPQVHKVVFVVDRKDLDYQTMLEFNSFKKDSVDVTDNTQSLVKQLTDETKLVLTTIQKLNNAITKQHYETKMSHLKDKKIVFIFDECHRSQFGETHDRIIEYFKKSQLFGFTGTPIFAENANKNEFGKRTTKDLFGKCLHKYVITDAIRDQNVLKFGIEYVGKYKQKGNTFIDIEVEDIDKAEVLNSPKRLEKIVDYIIAYIACVKLFLAEHIKNSIKHEYDKKLEDLKNDFNKNNSVLNSVLASQNQGFQSGHAERVEAIKVFWKNYLIVRDCLKEIVIYDGTLLESEFDTLNTPNWTGNDWIEKQFNAMTYDRLEDMVKAQKEVDMVRPFLNEKLWLSYMFLDVFSGRIFFLYKEGTKNRKISHWKGDVALINMVKHNLSAAEFEAIRKTDRGSITAVQNFVEQNILAEIAEILTGKRAAEHLLEQAERLNELVRLKLKN